MVSSQEVSTLCAASISLVKDMKIKINGFDGAYTGELNSDKKPHGEGYFAKANDGAYDRGTYRNGLNHGIGKLFHNFDAVSCRLLDASNANKNWRGDR